MKTDYGAERVILFGSYAQGNAREDSDVDLLIVAKTSEKFHARLATALKTVRDLRRGIAFSPIVLTPDELRSRIECGDQFILEILTTGIEQ